MKRLPIVVAALLAAACQTTPPGAVKTAASQPPAATAPGASAAAVPTGVVNTGVTVTGSVRVPSTTMIAAGGMNLVAAGGGNMIAAGAGNIIAAGGMNYALLAVDESAVAGARVFLADAAGNAIPGLEAVTTDAKGEYKIQNVPPDFTFVVAAEVDLQGGKKATFQTLAKPGKLGATASLDAATTMIAANVLEGAAGADLGEFNPASFKTAAETAAKNLDATKLPDFSDRASVKAKVQALVEAVVELKATVEQMRTEIALVKQSLADLQAAVQRQGPRPGGPLQPRPSGAPSGQPPIGPRPSGAPSDGPPPTDRPSAWPSDLPPPSGAPSNRPNAPACTTGGTVSRGFVMPDAKVEMVEFKTPIQGQDPKTWPTGGTAAREGGFSSQVQQGCVYQLVYRDASRAVIGIYDAFVIEPGDAIIKLPMPNRFPPAPGTSAQPSAQPSGQPSGQPTLQPSAKPSGGPGTNACTTPTRIKIQTNTKGPAKIKFAAPGGGAGLQIVAEAQLTADGTAEVTVPFGCGHTVAIFDGTTKKAELQGFVIPAGSTDGFRIPI